MLEQAGKQRCYHCQAQPGKQRAAPIQSQTVQKIAAILIPPFVITHENFLQFQLGFRQAERLVPGDKFHKFRRFAAYRESVAAGRLFGIFDRSEGAAIGEFRIFGESDAVAMGGQIFGVGDVLDRYDFAAADKGGAVANFLDFCQVVVAD